LLEVEFEVVAFVVEVFVEFEPAVGFEYAGAVAVVFGLDFELDFAVFVF
jgi:hypothetical protein